MTLQPGDSAPGKPEATISTDEDKSVVEAKEPSLHRRILDGILPAFGLGDLPEAERAELNRVWHRLAPWPDSVAGLQQLKRRFIIVTLSNGNVNLLTRMAKRAGLPWDAVLSAEVFRAYKPDPAAYLGVARTFDVPPEAVMLVAAHHDDLAGARACGLRTAYIERPHEFGADQPKDVSPQPGNDLHAASLTALAQQLGAAAPDAAADATPDADNRAAWNT